MIPNSKSSFLFKIRQVCQCLANISKHSVDQAEAVVGAELFPKILYRLKDTDESVRKMAATCIREVVKHSPELSKLFVEAGGITATIEYLNENKGVARLPGILILGYVAGYDAHTAMSIITSKGVTVLKDSLIQVPDDLVKGASAWHWDRLVDIHPTMQNLSPNRNHSPIC
jgi:hypothetical protein